MKLTSSLLLLAAFLAPVAFAGDKEPKATEKKPTFTIAKETTFVTGPTYPDGRINYMDALNELRSKGVTPKTNANVLLVQAVGPKPEGATIPPAYFKWLGIESPPEKGAYFIGLDRFVKEFFKDYPRPLDAVYMDLERASQRPWKEKDFPHFAAWLKANEKPLALVAEAVKRPHYFSPLTQHETKNPVLIAALLPYAQKNREFGSALATRAMLRLGEGKTHDAWQDLLSVHRLARHVGKGSTLIEGLIGFALESIASSADVAFADAAKLDSRGLLACLRDLQSLPPSPRVSELIDVGERFMLLDAVMMVDRQGVKGLEGLAGPPGKGEAAALGFFDKIIFKDIQWDAALKKANQFYDRMVAATRHEDAVVSDQKLEEIEMDIRKLKASIKPLVLFFGGKSGAERGTILGDILITLMLPATRKVATAERRTDQVIINTQTAFALEAFRRDEGHYPKTLDDLAPKYLKNVPIDVFTGKALTYRPEDKGYLLYSVGPNRKDDNGRFFDADPPGDDPGVRIPLPILGHRP